MSPAYVDDADGPFERTDFRIVQERQGTRIVVRESVAAGEIENAVALFDFMAPADLRTFVESRTISVSPWEPVEAPEPVAVTPWVPPVPDGGEGGRCVRHGVVARRPVWFLRVGTIYAAWEARCPEEHRRNGKPAVCFAPLELPETSPE